MSIILWIITSLLWSLWSTYWKKSTDNSTLPNWLFVLLGPIIWIFFIYTLVFTIWINTDILSDKKIIILLVVAWLFDAIWSILEAWIYKKVKISKILPYSSFDKLFVIVLWFILFYWNEGYTSISTLIIAIFTVLIIVLFSFDYKNISIEKEILYYIFVKLMYSIATLIMWGVLLSYTTIDMFSILIIVYLCIHLIFNLIIKNNFSNLLKQSKTFYKYRIWWSVIWWASFVLWFFIIENSWVLIASLLSFITIVFSIISMKYILGDSPNKKQIILAILVVILIWVWYSFK